MRRCAQSVLNNVVEDPVQNMRGDTRQDRDVCLKHMRVDILQRNSEARRWLLDRQELRRVDGLLWLDSDDMTVALHHVIGRVAE